MKTELFTVSKIFTESLYRIPDYQRGYSWGLDQLKDFWLDLEQLQDDSKHYIGVLTLEEVPEEKWGKWEDDSWIIKSRHFKPYYVVDGQQRLTTIVILIEALLERDSPLYYNYTELKDIRRKYIFDSKPEESSRSYIFGYEKDNPSYEYLKTKIFLERSEVHHPYEETIYTKNLLSAKEFFVEKITKMSDEEANVLFTKATQQFVFNAYEISSDIDVFVTFETMNNRGKPLTTLELLKNRLIFLSTKLPTMDGTENRLRRVINDAWKTAYHFLGKNEKYVIEDDDFLKTFLAYYYFVNIEKIPDQDDEETNKKRFKFVNMMEEFSRFLLNELFTQKRIAQDQDNRLPEISRDLLFNFSDQLKESVELYYKLNTPNDSGYTVAEKIKLEQLCRLRNYGPSYILFSIYKIETNVEKRIKILEVMERSNFIYSLSGRNYSRKNRKKYGYDFTMLYSSGSMTSDKLIHEYRQMIDEALKENNLAELLCDWVRNGNGYYGWKFIRYFLFEYEMYLKGISKTDRDKIDWIVFNNENYDDDYQTIEHIYPQNARDKYWTDRFSIYNQNQKKILRNSLGNLLALSKPKNSSLSNKPFVEKRDTLTTGYRYGSYSENEVSACQEWTPNEILERGLKMLDFLELHWKLTIGDKKKKIEALGLSFLNIN
jgi:uncharacterized protein with ParB-like and HNH nuclease domain